ncbi:MAG: hypothetical protein AB7G62_01320 [Magnetospirillum sp.]
MNNVLTINDLHLVADEARVLDLRIAERLGMADPHDIRRTIESNRIELEMHGEVSGRRPETGSKGGRPGTEYWLNEAQTLLLCMFSKTENAAMIRKEVIEVYIAYRHGRPATEQGAQGPYVVKMNFEDYTTLLQRMSQAISAMHELHEKKSHPMSMGRETVRLLIAETSLDDHEIAKKMEPLVEQYAPEWVAFHRRKLIEESARSH